MDFWFEGTRCHREKVGLSTLGLIAHNIMQGVNEIIDKMTNRRWTTDYLCNEQSCHSHHCQYIDHP